MLNFKRKPSAAEIIFFVYSLILLWIILFKTSFSFSELSLFSGERRVNLIPFHYDSDVGGFHLREVVMNVIVFVPFGLYLKMLDKAFAKTVLFGCCFSFLLELLQLILAIGACDVTDLITNTAGTAIGGGLYILAKKIFGDKAKTDRIINVMASVVLLLFLSLAVILFIAN